MPTATDEIGNSFRPRLVLAARVFSCVAGLIGIAGLVGYIFGVHLLVTVRPGLRGMSPLTSGMLILLSAGAFSLTALQIRTMRTLAGTAAALSVFVLLEHGIAGADVASTWIGVGVFGLQDAAIGHSSVATAIAALLVSAALLSRSERTYFADICGGAGLVVSGMALLGYAYGIGDLYALPMFNSMAVHTAAALFLLSLASLVARPDAGWAAVFASDGLGGGATRRQLAFTILPAVAGWLLLRATDASRLGPGVAMALLVVLTVAPLALLVLRDGRILDALGRETQARADLQEQAATEMSVQLSRQASELSLESEERAKAEAVLYRAQRMEAVGLLTGGIAHDFNNLLMAIRGNLELLQRRLPDGDERAARFLGNATAATDKGAKVTAQLLAFSRSQRLNIRSVELDPVLVNARELVGNSAGPDVEVILDLASPGAWARTDPDQLELAILNMIVNARDAMPNGGTLRISSRPCHVRLLSEQDESPYLSIVVSDTGVGMSAEVAAKAVEPFFTTKEQGKGTGLGLAQVYGFVRQCGGDLRIESEPGKGTKIEILLACVEPAPAEDAVPGPATADYERRVAVTDKPILVVDDDDAVRSVIVEALTSAGFEVVEASDGRSALSLLEKVKPSAAVIDFLMPGMNGAEVARHAQARLPGLPIVFVSGYSETIALDQIAGAVVLRKPFDVDGLNRALNSVLH
jgi:signal transduction histidine kinase